MRSAAAGKRAYRRTGVSAEGRSPQGERPQTFAQLPRGTRVYVGAVIAAGAVLVGVAGFLARVEQIDLFLVLLVLSPLAATMKIPLAQATSGLISYTVDFTALLVFGPHAATLIAVTSAYSQCTFRVRQRNPLHRTLFSMAGFAITMQAAGIVFGLLHPASDDHLTAMLRPLGPTALVYFVLNSGLVAGAIALTTRRPLHRVWQDHFLWSGPSYFLGAAMATLAALALRRGASSEWVVLVAVPVYLTYRSYQLFLRRIEQEQAQARQASDVQLATIEALALAIEAKDRTSQTQIRQMQKYAAALGRAAGLDENEVRGLETAALLHDVGNLAVPEHILSKSGPLTYEEFLKVKIHPRIGADILRDVPFPYPVAQLILAHHEHWDGNGYPHGLRRDEIPLGARILAVVDSYFALSTDRPHRPAYPFQEVVALLRRASGTILDPSLTETFITLLPQLEFRSAEAAGEEREPGSEARVEGPGHLEHIADAHQEARALFEIAQALGSSLGVAETMGLIAANLERLVPFACCALFLHDDATDTLGCRFALGAESERMRQIVVPDEPGQAGVAALEAAGLQGGSLRSVLVAPLVFNDRTYGVLAIFHGFPDFYEDDHRRLLKRVADQASSVIRNSIVFERTQEESFTDLLTSLPNRRYMLLYLNQQMARAERHRSQLAVVVMDLDEFKAINDTLGHHAGDRALRAVAGVLRTTVRSYDLCVRYGGDEFVVILWECDGEQAERRKRELESAVTSMPVEVRPGEFTTLSVSAGVAIFPEDGRSYEDLIAVADRRMYEEKSGRKPGAPEAVVAMASPS